MARWQRQIQNQGFRFKPNVKKKRGTQLFGGESMADEAKPARQRNTENLRKGEEHDDDDDDDDGAEVGDHGPARWHDEENVRKHGTILVWERTLPNRLRLNRFGLNMPLTG